MANTSFIISELDFDGIKQNLIDYLQGQSVFSGYNFAGAGLNVLLDILALNTHMGAYYLNMLASESFLDTAQVRDNIVSRAKHLNYTPTSRRAAVANVNLLVTPPAANTLATISLPAYTEFQSEAIDGINYTFVTLSSTSASKNLTSNTFTFSNVQIYQGEKFTYSVAIDSTNINAILTIPDANVDTSTMTVAVKPTSLSSSQSVFNQVTDITTILANSNVYFLTATSGGRYGVSFGDGYLGKSLSNGNIVQINYISTAGDVPNYANNFSINGTVSGFANVIVSSLSPAGGGAERQSEESIRFRAPIAYTRQNRSVTTTDYKQNLIDNYPNIDQIAVWPGEENDPIIYGKVFLSIKPVANYYITNIEKLRIAADLLENQNVLGITPVFVDPEYLYIRVDTQVYYDSTLTTKSQSEVETTVRNSIIGYTANALDAFNATYKYSKLQNAIDTSDPSIQNSDLTVTLQKRFAPATGNTQNYTINFNTELHRGGINDKLYSYPSFTIADSTGAVRTAYLEETPFSYTGVQEIQVTAAGSSYTTPPSVVINGDGVGANAYATIVNGAVTTITVDQAGSDYTIANVSFTGDGTGAAATAVLSGRNGVLRTFYYETNGSKIIINDTAGTIDYLNGIVKLNSFNPLSIEQNSNYANGVMTLNVEAAKQTIPPVRNNIIILDESDPLSISVSSSQVSS